MNTWEIWFDTMQDFIKNRRSYINVWISAMKRYPYGNAVRITDPFVRGTTGQRRISSQKASNVELLVRTNC